MARTGLFGGGVTSRVPRGEGRRSRGEEEKKKKTPPLRVILRDAADLVAARKGRLVLGFGILFVNRLAGFVIPFMPRYLLDEVLGKGRRELLPTLVLAAAAATLIQAVTSYSLSQFLGKAAQRSITELRREVQRHVAAPDLLLRPDEGRILLSRVMTDAEGIRNLVGTGLVEVVGGLVTAIIALVILFALTKLTSIALAVLSLFGLVLLFAFKTLRPLFRERSKINAEVSGRLTESFSGVRVVKAYRAERREAIVFSKGVHRLFRNVAKTMTGFSAVSAFSTLLFGRLASSIMWVGATDMLAGRMTVGQFFLHPVPGPARRAHRADRLDRQPDHRGLRGPRENPRDPQRDDRRTRKTPPARGSNASTGGRVPGRLLRIPRRNACPARRLLHGPARHLDGPGGPIGLRQVHDHRPRRGLLPPDLRADPGRRP